MDIACVGPFGKKALKLNAPESLQARSCPKKRTISIDFGLPVTIRCEASHGARYVFLSFQPNHKIQQFSAINSRMVTLPDLRLVIVKRRTYLLKALQRRSGTGPASPGLSMVPAFARDYEAKKNSSRSIL